MGHKLFLPFQRLGLQVTTIRLGDRRGSDHSWLTTVPLEVARSIEPGGIEGAFSLEGADFPFLLEGETDIV